MVDSGEKDKFDLGVEGLILKIVLNQHDFFTPINCSVLTLKYHRIWWSDQLKGRWTFLSLFLRWAIAATYCFFLHI